MINHENPSIPPSIAIPDVFNLAKVEPLFESPFSISIPVVENPKSDSKARGEVYNFNGRVKGAHSRAALCLWDTGELGMSLMTSTEWEREAVGIGISTVSAGIRESSLLIAPLSLESVGHEFAMGIFDLGKDIEEVEIYLPLQPFPLEVFSIDESTMAATVADSIRKGHFRGKSHDYEINNNFKAWVDYLARNRENLPDSIIQTIEETLKELNVQI